MVFFITRTSVALAAIAEAPCEGLTRSTENGRTAWTKEIATFAELTRFIDEQGEIIISCNVQENVGHIEIYDDYRE